MLSKLRNSLCELCTALIFFCGCSNEPLQPIRSGEIWPDNNGEHINAHGGGVMYHDGTYYWFGENKCDTTSSAMVGVMCYSSRNLTDWKNEGVALQEKTEKAQKSWAQREQNLQAEAAQLQQKYEKGLITSRDAQAQQESIQKKVASYQSNAQKEAQTLDEENYVFTNRAQDLLHRAVQEINSGKKYKLILNASALIDADTTLNITPAVLAKVNELYAADKKAEKK